MSCELSCLLTISNVFSNAKKALGEKYRQVPADREAMQESPSTPLRQAFDSVRLAPLFAQDDIWKRFVSDLEISRFLLFLSFFFSSLPPSSKSFFRTDSYNPSH
jgi:hypothetical protein